MVFYIYSIRSIFHCFVVALLSLIFSIDRALAFHHEIFDCTDADPAATPIIETSTIAIFKYQECSNYRVVTALTIPF